MRNRRKIIKVKHKTCHGSLKQSDHNWGFPLDQCAWCGTSRSAILEASANKMFEDSLEKLRIQFDKDLKEGKIK